MRLLKGKKIAGKTLNDLKKALQKQKLKPGLAVILVGENKASKVYVGLKKKAAKAVGINFYLFKFKKFEKEAEVIKKIKELNEDKKINGMIVQLPLPDGFNTQKIINMINVKKDADGFHPVNLKVFLAGRSRVYPVFPKAIIKILEFSRVNLRNKQAIVVANSKIFGETMRVALRGKGIKADYILAGEIKKKTTQIMNADILITAIGKPGLIRGDIVKNGAVVIDGGITKIGRKVAGDIDFNSVKKKASYITPVPGGVGPVTIACLLENVYLLSKKSR
ncbi:MAG: bifunctional 5,10-methylenetetrahydrofolate dehydrogenase/5,10-methenyltetrahydrofolate cyclohydrolase [Parcubacteria group bacterium]|jgi:methylenetetrahydrofolate dehydrogenase (NADP+)/methenyltetrahydrofolate cyclohydrolase